MVYSPPISQHEASDELAALPAYGPGSQVTTDQGEVPLEWLATGDRVLTRDHGYQPVLWIGRARFGAEAMTRRPAFAPLEIAATAVGDGRPSHPTVLAPRTRVMLSGWEVALNAGADEALVEVGDLVESTAAARSPIAGGVAYTYLLMPMHEVVRINGLWVETLLLDRAARHALEGILPAGLADRVAATDGHGQSVRLCLAAWEVTAILGGAKRAAPRVIAHVA